MAINQVTTRELLQSTQGSMNVGIQSLRASIDNANRKIVLLQKDLQKLKASYILALQNINRNMTKEDLEKYFLPDRFQTINPILTIKTYDVMTPDPDPRINWARRRLEEMTGEHKKELSRLENEVKKVSSAIVYFTNLKKVCSERLAKMDNANILSARDNIARMQYEIIYILEEVSKRYLDLSTDSRGNRIYSKSAPIIRQYTILLDTFRAYASRDPDVKKGNLKLLLEDPGCPENRTAIKEVLDRREKVLADGGLLPGIEKISNKMKANINDSFISENVSRQATEKRLPPADNAVTEIVGNVDKLVSSVFTGVNNFLSGLTPAGKPSQNLVGQYLNMSYDSTGYSGAVINFFNKIMQHNYDNIPLCDSTQTPEDQAKTTDNANMQKAEADAAVMSVGQFTQAARKLTRSRDEATASLKDYLTVVNVAIKEPSNPMAFWSSSLDLAQKTYRSMIYHDAKVLDKAKPAADMAGTYRNNGDITEDEYNTYITSLQDAIEEGTGCIINSRMP